MAYIKLGKIDKTQIPMAVGCVFCFLNRLLNQNKDTLLFKNPILTNIYISISRFLTFIPYLILRSRIKKITSYNNENQGINRIEYLYYDNRYEIVEGKWKYIIFSAIVYLIQSICFVVSFTIQTNSWIWFILIASLFYYFIYKVKLYKHQLLSAILIILIGIITDLASDNLQNEIVNDPLLLVMKYLKEVFISFYNVIAKYVMEKKFVSVYEFSFYIGAINLILLGIFSIFDHFLFGLYNYEEYFNNFNMTEFWIMLGTIFSQLIINVASLFAIKDCSPCHVFIMFVFGQLAYYMFLKGYKVLVNIGLIVIIFLTLIFIELIEIDFCGLSHDTKNNISNRANKEDFDVCKSDTLDEDCEKDENLLELREKEIYNYKLKKKYKRVIIYYFICHIKNYIEYNPCIFE